MLQMHNELMTKWLDRNEKYQYISEQIDFANITDLIWQSKYKQSK